MKMFELFNIGDVIYGYCNGFFGDDWETKTCVFITSNYAVFQNKDGCGTILNYEKMIVSLVDEWKKL